MKLKYIKFFHIILLIQKFLKKAHKNVSYYNFTSKKKTREKKIRNYEIRRLDNPNTGRMCVLLLTLTSNKKTNKELKPFLVSEREA